VDGRTAVLSGRARADRGGEALEWMDDEGCRRWLLALMAGIVGALVGLGAALGYPLRWLTRG
jgi:hypothetical protein